MKNRTISRILTIVMLVGCLSFGMIGASATNYYDATVECSQGVYVYEELVGLQCETGSVAGFSDSLPSGVDVTVYSDGQYASLVLYGTPGAYGLYRFDVYFYDGSGSGAIECTCHVDMYVYSPGVTLPAFSQTYTVGDDVLLEFYDFSTGGEIFDGSCTGSVPGLSVSYYDSYITLGGTVSTAGTYTLQLRAYDDSSMGWRSKSVTITVKDKAKLPPTVTKHPTGETVTEGESAVFIARADDADKIIWRLVSPDKSNTIECRDAKKYYPKLEVYGLETEELVLVNIPLELDGWKVEAKFEGPGGTSFSKGALLTVKKAELKKPVINAQPQGAQLQQGQSVTLSVGASSPDGNALRYQWYRSSSDSNSGGEAIPGATGASYVPGYIEGTAWYYCAVRSTKGEETSAAAVSDCAAVSYTAAPADTPAPTQAPTEPTPTREPEPSVRPSRDRDEHDDEPQKADHTVAIVIGVVACVAILGACATVIILKRMPRD